MPIAHHGSPSTHGSLEWWSKAELLVQYKYVLRTGNIHRNSIRCISTIDRSTATTQLSRGTYWIAIEPKKLKNYKQPAANYSTIPDCMTFRFCFRKNDRSSWRRRLLNKQEKLHSKQEKYLLPGICLDVKSAKCNHKDDVLSNKLFYLIENAKKH